MFIYPGTSKLNTNPRMKCFLVVVAGCFFLFVVRIVSLPIFSCLDLVVCGICEGFSTMMRVCLKLKIAWFHEITHKFYIFRMQIWTDNYSLLSFHLAFSIRHSALGIRQTAFHFCFICKNSFYFQFIGLIMPSVVGCFLLTNRVESRRSRWFYACCIM